MALTNPNKDAEYINKLVEIKRYYRSEEKFAELNEAADKALEESDYTENWRRNREELEKFLTEYFQLDQKSSSYIKLTKKVEEVPEEENTDPLPDEEEEILGVRYGNDYSDRVNTLTDNMDEIPSSFSYIIEIGNSPIEPTYAIGNENETHISIIDRIQEAESDIDDLEKADEEFQEILGEYPERDSEEFKPVQDRLQVLEETVEELKEKLEEKDSGE